MAYYHKIDRLEDIYTELLPNYEPTVHPFTNTILYSYDYGDGWCVRVTCARVYKSPATEVSEMAEHILSISTKKADLYCSGWCLLGR